MWLKTVPGGKGGKVYVGPVKTFASVRVSKIAFTSSPSQLVYLYTFNHRDLFLLGVRLSVESKGKAVPLQAVTGPEGSRRLRLPDFKTIGT
jgi:hypothetical protein